jgi:hypothetical protein
MYLGGVRAGYNLRCDCLWSFLILVFGQVALKSSFLPKGMAVEVSKIGF